MNTTNRSLTVGSHVNEARRRFIVNVVSQVGFLGVNTAIMLWYIPFLIGHLGVAAYGMASLANSLVAYSVIISMGVEVTVNRFLAIDINSRDDTAANRTFNAALALSLSACAMLLPPAILVAYFFPDLFNVPPGLEFETQLLFASACVATLIAIVSGNFGVSAIIMHRFDLRNAVRLLGSIVRVGCVVISFLFWDPSLWQVSAGLVLAAAVGLSGDVLVWRRLTPQLHIQPRNFDSHQFRSLFTLGGWETVNQFGFLLLTQVNLVIVNAIFGAEMTGRYGALMPFTSLISTMTAAVSEVARPAILACYAAGDVAGIRKIAVHSTKLLGVGLALPIGLLCGFGAPLLTLWLGKDFAGLDVLLAILAGHLTLNSGILPLIYVITAYNRVKAEALVTLFLGCASILLAVAFAHWTNWGASGVAAATAIMWTIRNVGVLTSYSAVLMGMRWWALYGPLAIGAVATASVGLVAKYVSEFWWPESWLALFTWSSAIALVYVPVAYAVLLDKADRELLKSFLRSRRPANKKE